MTLESPIWTEALQDLPLQWSDAEGLRALLAGLIAALQSHSPLPLVSARNPRALYEDAKGPSGRAIRALLNGSSPLLKLRKRKSTSGPRKVSITKQGIRVLVLLASSSDRVRILDQAADKHREAVLLAWVELSNASHDHWKSDQETLSHHCDLKELNIAEDQNIHTLAPSPKEPEPASPPSPSDHAAFKRELTHELVISWKYAESAEAKEGIARALLNTGVTQLGEVGAETEFVGRYHRCEEALFPGDRVRVMQPGWLIHDGVGEFLLEKAFVEPA